MFAKFGFKPVLVLFAVVLLSTLAAGSTVTAKEGAFNTGAIPAVIPDPVPGGPGFISVSTYGFKPYDPAWTLGYSNTWMYNNGTEGANYITSVNLPHGAILTKVVFFYYDTVPGGGMDYYLQSVNMFDGSLTEVAGGSSNGSDGFGYVEIPIYEPLIDNQLYSYVIEADFPGGFGTNLSLINIRIDYGYSSFLANVQK
jgi:hypothetical protein